MCHDLGYKLQRGDPNSKVTKMAYKSFFRARHKLHSLNMFIKLLFNQLTWTDHVTLMLCLQLWKIYFCVLKVSTVNCSKFVDMSKRNLINYRKNIKKLVENKLN